MPEIDFSNLSKWEEAPFLGLGAYIISFFNFQNHFLKIHAQQIPKNVQLLSFEPFPAEKIAVKDKKARFTPFVPPTHIQQQVGWGTRLEQH